MSFFCGFRLCSFVFWVLWVRYQFKCCLWGGMAEWYSSFMSSGTNQFFKFQTKMVRCHVDEKKWVLELGELEYHKKWYLPKYFRNNVADPIISKISANGPFCPIALDLSHYGLILFRPNFALALQIFHQIQTDTTQ